MSLALDVHASSPSWMIAASSKANARIEARMQGIVDAST